MEKKIGFISGAEFAIMGIQLVAERNNLAVEPYSTLEIGLDEITDFIVQSQLALVIIDIDLFGDNGNTDGLEYANSLKEQGIATAIRASEKHRNEIEENGHSFLNISEDGVQLMRSALGQNV